MEEHVIDEMRRVLLRGQIIAHRHSLVE